MYGDRAFNNPEFADFLTESGSRLGLVPPCQHSKSVTESKHGIIRSIHKSLKTYIAEHERHRLALCAIAISNNLAALDILYAFEVARCFAYPVSANRANSVTLVPDKLIKPQATRLAKRNPTRILRGKFIAEKPVGVSDRVGVHVKLAADKRGKWSSPQVMIGIKQENWTDTVPVSAGHTMQVAFEDVRRTIQEEYFAQLVSQSFDAFEAEVEALLHDTSLFYTDSDDAAGAILSDYNGATYTAEWLVIPAVGDSAEFFWPDDNQFYRGTVSAAVNNMYTVDYNDGHQETLVLANVTGLIASTATIRAMLAKIGVVSEQP